MSRRPLLGVVHPETGEVITCPACQTREDVIVQLEKENRLHKAKITKLERAEEQVSSNDPLWEEAQAIHEWWRLACWHPLTGFDLEDFKLIRPHLKRGKHGLIDCLEAICGAAFDPYEAEQKNGKLKAYNDWDTIFATKAKMERFAERVPGEEGDDATWRKFLVQKIESNLS